MSNFRLQEMAHKREQIEVGVLIWKVSICGNWNFENFNNGNWKECAFCEPELIPCVKQKFLNYERKWQTWKPKNPRELNRWHLQ